LDELPVNKIVEFSQGLRDYIKANKPKYVEILKGEKKLSDEAETILKESIKEYKQAFIV
jgi:F-type H+-transporting ATPase subunit alpha